MNASPPSDSFASSLSMVRSPSSWFARGLNRLQPSPETVVLMLAVAIGSGTGLAVVGFHFLIDKIHSLMLEDFMGVIASLGAWTLATIPVIGGLVVGLMRWRWQDFGPGIASLLSTAQGVESLSSVQASAKAVAASVSLGTGASLGPEGPSVEIGASIGAILGQALQVSQERQRLLLGAGAAAGLAAGFNAPIAGVFFALEVVLGTTFATSAVSVVLLSAVVAALITQIGQGGQPAFALPVYEVRSSLELPLYLGLGLFACLISIAYTQSIQWAQNFFQGNVTRGAWMGRVPLLLRPAIGGVVVGIVALQFPQILGIGYETVEAMLRDAQFSLWLLLTLLVVKLAMTAISLGSGLVGGVFAPAMFLGASLGAAYGKLLPLVLPIDPHWIAAPPAYAMVGMAAVLAASARAPLTAILLLFEMTRDYRIILPLMAAVGLSAWLVERLKPIARHAPTLQSTGLNVQPDPNVEFLTHLPVGRAMHQSFLTLTTSVPVLQAGLMLTRHQARSVLVVNEAYELIGIVTLQDIRRAVSRWEKDSDSSEHLPSDSTSSQTLGEICTKDLLYAYQDEPTSDALARMATRGLRQLPVVDRNDPTHILGLLEQEKVSLVFSLEMTQQLLQPYIEKPAVLAEPLNLSISEQSAA